MLLSKFTPEDLDVLHRCLRVSADDQTLFEDWEFPTLFGIERSELLKILRDWPKVDETTAETQCAIQNALNHLLGYPHGHHDDWNEYFSFTRAQVIDVFAKWRGRLLDSYVEGAV